MIMKTSTSVQITPSTVQITSRLSPAQIQWKFRKTMNYKNLKKKP